MRYLFAFVIVLSVSNHCIAQAKLNNSYQSFIPDGFILLDKATGDLNKDVYPDMVLVLKSKEEEENEDSARPVLLLAGTKSETYKLIARSDSVVLCKGCGGVYGDPYERIVVKNGYFSIEHFGGSNWRWTRIITFKYDPLSKTFKLHKDGGDYFHVNDPDKAKTVVNNKKYYGKLKFEHFNNELP